MGWKNKLFSCVILPEIRSRNDLGRRSPKQFVIRKPVTIQLHTVGGEESPRPPDG